MTGTDTGVGKTVVAAAVAATWRRAEMDTVYVKPVQSGAADGDDDAAAVAALAGVPTVVGRVVGPSLAPGVAARMAGDDLRGDELAAVVDGATRAHPGAQLVVEGAGGLLVELGSDGTTCACLAARLRLPVVVVTRPGLGTLNHTALTLAEMRRHGLELAGLIVCAYPQDPDLATRSNLEELVRLSGRPLLGIVPEVDPLSPTTLRFEDDGPVRALLTGTDADTLLS